MSLKAYYANTSPSPKSEFACAFDRFKNEKSVLEENVRRKNDLIEQLTNTKDKLTLELVTNGAIHENELERQKFFVANLTADNNELMIKLMFVKLRDMMKDEEIQRSRIIIRMSTELLTLAKATI